MRLLWSFLLIGGAAAAAFASPPTLVQSPLAGTVAVGSTLALAVQVGGNASGLPLRYQWSKEGIAISGAADPILEIGNLQPAQAGHYSVQVSNADGVVNSAVATIQVTTTTNPGHLVNLSLGSYTGAGDQLLTAGFVSRGATGASTQPILLRGIGPTLANFGIADAVADPSLNLFPSGATAPIATDDDWNSDPQIAAVSNAVGAFALSAGSKDAALYLPSLAQGGYSAQIVSNDGSTGSALAEVYDAAPGTGYVATNAHLINLSGRAQVGGGSGVLTGGFFIGGVTGKTVLLRASGPALASFGITDGLSAPLLRLFAAGQALPFATNQAWSGNREIATTAQSVGAFAWSDPASADCALLLTLPPGGYTAQVSAVGGSFGAVLLEIYDVP